jgi:hypothetical protein
MWAIRLGSNESPVGKANWFRAFKWSKRPVSDDPSEEEEKLPVTISYATKFKRKRDAMEMAAKRGLADFEILKAWW